MKKENIQIDREATFLHFNITVEYTHFCQLHDFILN